MAEKTPSGMPIRTGEYCFNCQEEIDKLGERKKGTYNALKGMGGDDGSMRFLDK